MNVSFEPDEAMALRLAVKMSRATYAPTMSESEFKQWFVRWATEAVAIAVLKYGPEFLEQEFNPQIHAWNAPDVPPRSCSNNFQINNRTMIDRIRFVYQELAAGEVVTSTSIAKAAGVSSKTIARDVDFMRKRMSLSIKSTNVGYQLTETKPMCSLCAGIMSSTPLPAIA